VATADRPRSKLLGDGQSIYFVLQGLSHLWAEAFQNVLVELGQGGCPFRQSWTRGGGTALTLGAFAVLRRFGPGETPEVEASGDGAMRILDRNRCTVVTILIVAARLTSSLPPCGFGRLCR